MEHHARSRPIPPASLILALCFLLLAGSGGLTAAPGYTIATWNLENYLLSPRGTRPLKSPEARAAIRAAIRQIAPDVLALQEIGGAEGLSELRAALERDGLKYPHAVLCGGYDTNIQVALLSRLPVLRHENHENAAFLLHGRRFRTTRGILEADVQAPDGPQFTLLAVHLKSRRESVEAAQDEIREQEALLLRRMIDARLQADRTSRLVVLGDFNDTRDSRTLRTLLGRGRDGMVDTRPAEAGSAGEAPSVSGARSVTWTHFYAREDTYSRVDYILLSPGMARAWNRRGSWVHAWPDWGAASDHRPVVARFQATR